MERAGNPSRVVGRIAFAISLGRDENDETAKALYDALLEEGEHLRFVSADDDLAQRYGVVNEDFDDVVEAFVARINGGNVSVLRGQVASLSTPREILVWAETLLGR